jgi:hypothetical protein
MKVMKTILLFATLSLAAFAQVAPVTTAMPTYVGGYVNYNQDTVAHHVGMGALGAVPVSSQVGLYSVTCVDMSPAFKTDPGTGKRLLVLNPTVRTGLHKTLYTGTKFQLLLGGDLGLGASVGGPLMSVTGTVAYQLNSHLALLMPFRGSYVQAASAWSVIPEIALVWKPTTK